ncbi:methylmalonyl-CoA mutase subunit beta [uncultured Polaribacter sp.]|uniref:methylmalonyl-CoA mutase subunit beta n=1 Tax=uncultured Polaribacter sp. TaxID=174711 RepID=UPI0026282940|nr:methylmalonyl-CoA mutase subunit beta [uncultured Polaribacter sp.]
MTKYLFDDFKGTTPGAWKQRIQVDLKGADYNEKLLWKTNEGITIKPFYTKEDRKNHAIKLPEKDFKICQTIKIKDELKANAFALKSISTGATAIQFIAETKFDFTILLKGVNLDHTSIYFKLNFLEVDFIKDIASKINTGTIFFQFDILGNLAETGNWYYNLKEDFNQLKEISNLLENPIVINADLYQNAGANITQQLAYALAHANEYLNYFDNSIADKIHFQFAVGSNYFHEIAKLRAFRLLWSSLLNTYKIKEKEAHLFVQPSLRNKTIYDYNVNMLRTTSECMSAVLGSANTVSNLPYNAIFENANAFGERISKNQLLILQQESGFTNAQNFTDGSYYIETLTHQFAEKALPIFKQIEKGGGFLKQLKEGNIQKKIKESAVREETQFQKEEVFLLGTNLQVSKDDVMKNNITKDPFLKKRNIKTLIVPIIKKRLAEKIEQKRLQQEK